MKKPVVAIPVKNRLDLTRPLVEALLEDDGYGEIRVYDNGSTDGTREWLAGVPVLGLFTPDLSLHEMWNDAVKVAAGHEAPCVILNNDLVLDGKPGWLKRLCAPLGDGWAATCPNYDGREHWADVEPLQSICAGRYDGTGGLSGFAFALAPRVVRTYRFPEEMLWWFGDTDLCRTLDRRQEPYGMVIGCGVTHVGGGSQTAKDHDLSEQQAKDQAAFEAKWGALCTNP